MQDAEIFYHIYILYIYWSAPGKTSDDPEKGDGALQRLLSAGKENYSPGLRMDWQMGWRVPSLKKGGLDSMLQQYKQYVRVSHCSASHSKPVDTGKETQNDGKPWVQEEEC